MAVEYNPNDYGHMTPGQNPGQGQFPAQVNPAQLNPVQAHPPQAHPAPYQPQQAPAAHPQGQPVPYAPQQGQAAPQHPPAYHYPAQHPAQYPGQHPAQAYEPAPAQGYVPQQPGPQFQTPGEEQSEAQNEKPKSRFKRGKKAKAAKPPRAQKTKPVKDGASGGSSLKPFLMGLVTGAVLMFAGLVFMGNQAKKSLDSDYERVANQLQQMPMTETVIIGEDGTITEEMVVAETEADQPQ